MLRTGHCSSPGAGMLSGAMDGYAIAVGNGRDTERMLR